MALPFKPTDLLPANTSHFRSYSWRSEPGEGFDVERLVNPAAVSAVAESFSRSNTAHEGWAYGEDAGRIDSRRAWRFDELGDVEVFKDRRAPSASKVRLIVLVDASGSMGAADAHVEGFDFALARDEAAAIFAATIVKGLAPIPTLRVEVMQHDFGYSSKSGGYSRNASNSQYTTNIRRAWEPGTPVAFMNQMPNWRPGGGNADGHAIMAVSQYLKSSLLPDEVPMIIMISDGAPANVGKNPDADLVGTAYGTKGALGIAGLALKDAVISARAEGIHVLSVAIAGGEQGKYYGPENVVRFTGDWVALATDLAALVGNTVGTSYAAEKARYGDW